MVSNQSNYFIFKCIFMLYNKKEKNLRQNKFNFQQKKKVINRKPWGPGEDWEFPTDRRLKKQQEGEKQGVVSKLLSF